MGPEKHKLLVFSPHSMDSYSEYYKLYNDLEINGVPIKFVNSAEHVGMTRNLPNILHCIACYNIALASVLYAGTPRNNRGSPAAYL